MNYQFHEKIGLDRFLESVNADYSEGKHTISPDDINIRLSGTRTKMNIIKQGQTDCENLYTIFNSLNRIDSYDQSYFYRSYFNSVKHCSLKASFNE